MGKLSEWERIKQLGSGGQSEVFLVRRPARQAERDSCLKKLNELAGQGFDDNRSRAFAESVWKYARPENPSELAALKIFTPRAEGSDAAQQALGRLQREIAVLSENRPGLLKLLDSDATEQWIVTEYCSGGTLEDHPTKFQGNAAAALKAFRSLVEAVVPLHREGIVHRDIKPANVFTGDNGRLILGDFGIVFLPALPEHLTLTNERVGPRDYMPPWADLGERLEKVKPNFDVYMLGKLLWCMVAGRLKLPREWHRKPEFDLTVKFQGDPHIHAINAILDKCIVEDPDKCLPWAEELLLVVDSHLSVMNRGGQMLRDNVPRLCRVCGQGFYHADRAPVPAGQLRIWTGPSETNFLRVRLFICDACGHVQFFQGT